MRRDCSDEKRCAQAPSIAKLTAAVSHAFIGIFAAALEVAAPVLLALILTDVAFGVVSRVVPQLNIFALGFPLTLIGGFVALAISMNYLATPLQHMYEFALNAMLAFPVRAGQ